jgi:hypothetical protein
MSGEIAAQGASTQHGYSHHFGLTQTDFGRSSDLNNSFNEEIDIVHVANIHDCPIPRFGHPIFGEKG